jgi:hypothetical protein
MLHREADRIAERIRLGQGQPVTLSDLSPLAPASGPRRRRGLAWVSRNARDMGAVAAAGVLSFLAVLAVLAWL